MAQRVFISSKNTATFICPECSNAKTVDVSRYATTQQKVTVKCRCGCGHHFEVILEKRRQYRKTTDLPGTYFYQRANGEIDKGNMRVVDISSTGLKLKLSVARDFAVGDALRVEFHLDDKRRTFLEKKVIVRNVQNNLVGTAFAQSEGEDPHLGFYLMT